MLVPVSQLILYSRREADVAFFKGVAARADLQLLNVKDTITLSGVLSALPSAIVVFDADPNGRASPTYHKDMNDIREVISIIGSPNRCFALADNGISKYPELFIGNFFYQHLLYRRYKDPAQEVYAYLLANSLTTFPTGIKSYFPGGTAGQKIVLKKSAHRVPAVDAMQSFLEKKGIKSRLASRAAQATDELLLNAIFNAPHNSRGQAIRMVLPRDTQFEFGKNELVYLETMATPRYLGVCVIDSYGSLRKESVLGPLQKDYRTKGYAPRLGQAGTGLGIHGVAETGLSLLFMCKPGGRTEAMIFIPITDSHREFKESFRFISFYGGTQVKKPTGYSGR